jgi:hypothetical protein
MPYGFTSPLAGTVEASLLTLVNFARNGPELGGDCAGVVALAAELVLDELLVLLELPHPASANAAIGAARINRLFTLNPPWFFAGTTSAGRGVPARASAWAAREDSASSVILPRLA